MRRFVLFSFFLASVLSYGLSETQQTELQEISLDFEIASAALNPASARLALSLAESIVETGALKLELIAVKQLYSESRTDLTEAQKQVETYRLDLSSSIAREVALEGSFKDYREGSEALVKKAGRRGFWIGTVVGFVLGVGGTALVWALVK